MSRFDTKVSLRIKELRGAHDLTQAQLALKMGIAQPELNQLEAGKRNLLPRFAVALEEVFIGQLEDASALTAREWMILQVDCDLADFASSQAQSPAKAAG